MSQQPVWDPGQYHRFGDLRLRPALELFARISVENPSVVHDIGTGGGEIAGLMAQRWPNARVIGSDSSQEMLDKAADSAPSVEWRLLDVADWRPAAEHDVIYANAVLHWLSDHDEAFPRLVAGLVSDGELAVQMPMSWWQPSHQVIRETLAHLNGPEAAALGKSMEQPNVFPPDRYYDILRPIVSSLDIWETTYQQTLTGRDPIFEWVSGTMLRPILTQLPANDAARFSELCRRGLREAYPPQTDGTTLFPFRRLFVVARR
jgi:trans-aconitate 2-methyltransferase